MIIKGPTWVWLKKGSRFTYDFKNEARNVIETREVILQEDAGIYLENQKYKVDVMAEIIKEEPIED